MIKRSFLPTLPSVLGKPTEDYEIDLFLMPLHVRFLKRECSRKNALAGLGCCCSVFKRETVPIPESFVKQIVDKDLIAFRSRCQPRRPHDCIPYRNYMFI